MKHYKIPLVWSEYGVAEVDANSLEEAVAYALGPDCPLPDGSYLDDTIEFDRDSYDDSLCYEVVDA